MLTLTVVISLCCRECEAKESFLEARWRGRRPMERGELLYNRGERLETERRQLSFECIFCKREIGQLEINKSKGYKIFFFLNKENCH
jgi:hypothetical protein